MLAKCLLYQDQRYIIVFRLGLRRPGETPWSLLECLGTVNMWHIGLANS